MKKLALLASVCVLLCITAVADPCPSSGGIGAYSNLSCQIGPITLDFGQITFTDNMQNPPNPQIVVPPNILYEIFLGIPGVGVLHPGEFFDINIPITYIVPPCCQILDFSTQIFGLQGCCVDFQSGPTGITLDAFNSGNSDLSWTLALAGDTYSVPEPATLALLLPGLAAGGMFLRRRML
ncbi:MAG TPA: PEP-CTERM sorting domain-containing protein [Terriglobales bacterium]|nr:PEP-CTERM sorting domain-containing protein [Terriglobales bacterium]